MQEALAIKIRETLLDVFLWESGVFSFDDESPPALDELDASVPLADIAREAEFRATAWSAMRGEFPTGAAALEVSPAELPPELGPDTIDGKVVASRATARRSTRVPLSAADRYLLSRCDGRRAVHDLAVLAPFAELELLKGIRRLVEAELVELRPH